MIKLLLAVLCFNGFSCYLVVPEQENHVKKCVEDIINNVIGTNGTLVYVYDGTSDDLLPAGMEGPIVTIDAGKEMVKDQSHEVYNELVFLNLKNMGLMLQYIKKMADRKSHSKLKRKYIVVYSLGERYYLQKIFSEFFNCHVMDIIALTYDFNLVSNTIQVFTWDPYHPSNNCGHKFVIVEKNTCKMANFIGKLGRTKNYNKCNVSFIKQPLFREGYFVLKFLIRIIASYEIAKPKLKLAEEQSDLNSDNEQAKRNRKFKRKKVLASSDDECDNKDESQKIDNCSNSITHNIEDGEYSSENEDISDGDMLPTIHRPLLSSTRPHHSKHQQALKNSTPSSRPSSSQSFTSDEDFKTKLLQQLSAIKVNLIKLNRRISLLENSKENVSKEDTIENETSKQYEEFISNIFPLQNEEDLVVVEVKLEEEPGFKVKLFTISISVFRIGTVAVLAVTKPTKITKLMLRRLFSDKLASLYSWLGAKKKKVFCHLQLANVIINSVCTANKNTANCTEKDVVDSIKNWLRHASTRDKKNKVCV
ncbi:hypothetical protein FQA39_LY11693 [Lamprigera yunnana]|nr:hypothetical protein FQA39_LY11693 [Lamprigera yunnana]